MKKRFAGILALAVTAALLAPVSSVAQAGTSSKCWDYKTSEKKFARKANAARANIGLGKLKLDPELSKVALKHTKEMVKANNLFHTSSDQLRARVTNWTLLGENVGVGGSVDSLHEAFMNSPSHAANILHLSYRYHGVGVVKAHGRMWVTVIFSATQDPGTTLRMPTC
jgi:uncharacterized protein YkwD